MLVERARARLPVAAAVVALAYFVTAKAGLHLAFANKNVTAVWPPTGIAVAALLLLGVRIWPSIAIGAFVSNLSNGAGWETSTLITVGNTTAPLVAWLLIRRAARLNTRLERVPDVAGVLLLGGPVAMTVSATLGTLALALTSSLHWSAYGSTWLTWWVGDAMGVVIVAPLVLVAAARCWRSVRFDAFRVFEAAAALVCLAATSVIAFGHTLPITYLVLPVATWAAVRFFQLGAGAAVAIVSAVSIVATIDGHGPFVQGLSTTASLITLQAFNGALALTTFMLAAASLQHIRARAALEDHVDELESLLRQERLAALGDMTAVVSHDLRNPLATIANSHYLLREVLGENLTSDAATTLELAERATTRAVALIEELLEYRRPKRLELSEVYLRDLVDRVIETTPPPSGVTLSTECAPVRIRVDPGQMTRILANIISNAYEAMDGVGSLSLSGRVDGDTVIISVADTGPGFGEADMDRIFEPFFSTKSSGTGLGLAIVQRLAQNHGGSVRAENGPLGGSVVTVALPRNVARRASTTDR